MSSRPTIILAAAIALLHAPFGFAEETATEAPVIEVVVTADRVETDILSTAAHVSIITSEDIRESGATNLVALLERQPGVNFRSYSNEGQASIDMRGFGEGSTGRVLILVDGRRQNNPDMSGINWLAIPVDAIERVEVLRGSASALYGNNAVGGVINIITKTADRPLEITAFGSLGSFGDSFTRQGRIGVLHAGEDYRTRGSVEQFDTDGYRDRSAYEALNFSFGGEFDATNSLIVSFGSRYAGIEYELPGSLTREEFRDDPTQASNKSDENRENQFAVNTGLAWGIGELLATNLDLGYNLKMAESDTESFGSYANRNTNTFSATPTVELDWYITGIPGRTRIGADFHWAKQDIAEYSDKKRETKTNEATLGRWMLGTSLSNAIYLTEHVDFSAAVRYDRSEISAEKDAADIDEETIHDAIVFDAGLVFRPTDSTKVYAKGGTLFRYPHLDEQADINFANQFENDLDPEKGFQVELGAALYTDRPLSVGASAYWLQMRDEIAYVVDPVTFAGSNENLDETRRIGGDIQIGGELIDLLRISAGYSYVNAIFIKGDNKESEIPLVPNHSADAELGVRPIDGLELGPAIRFRGEAYPGGDNANGQDKVDSHLLTDLFLRFRPADVPGDLAISGSFKNIFNESYAPLEVYDDFNDRIAYYPAPGRSFEIAASYTY
ncbi:MAG: TonB-dependent receptor [Spirochaetes bacterium]|jgi:iron complex outermembrane receptor protein|nr:TonB-dependent receptor [Spirochaetota bacterium]